MLTPSRVSFDQAFSLTFCASHTIASLSFIFFLLKFWVYAILASIPTLAYSDSTGQKNCFALSNSIIAPLSPGCATSLITAFVLKPWQYSKNDLSLTMDVSNGRSWAQLYGQTQALFTQDHLLVWPAAWIQTNVIISFSCLPSAHSPQLYSDKKLLFRTSQKTIKITKQPTLWRQPNSLFEQRWC